MAGAIVIGVFLVICAVCAVVGKAQSELDHLLDGPLDGPDFDANLAARWRD